MLSDFIAVLYSWRVLRAKRAAVQHVLIATGDRAMKSRAEGHGLACQKLESYANETNLDPKSLMQKLLQRRTAHIMIGLFLLGKTIAAEMVIVVSWVNYCRIR